MRYFLNYMIAPVIFFLLLIMVSNVYSSEREHEEHEHHHSDPINGIDGANGVDGKDGLRGKNFQSIIPMVQHQFNPDSKKTQLSIGLSTYDFEGNNSIGISMGKKFCNKDCYSSFWHGGVTTNGKETGGNVGVTLSWE